MYFDLVMAILVLKKYNHRNHQSHFFFKILSSMDIGLLVLLTRTFFHWKWRFQNGWAGTDILKDIKNSKPNWSRGQFRKKNITTTFYKSGFLTIYIISRLTYKLPEGPNPSKLFFYCVLN